MAVDPNAITDVTGEDRQRYIDAFGARGVFAPGVPMPPVVSDDEKPRVFDYQSGINLYMQPRSGYGQLPFSSLKNFADMSDAVRIVIEAIKREIRSAEWHIKPKNENDEQDYSREIERITEMWRMPDGIIEFDAWCNSVLEDLLVYDAVSLWLDVDAGGNLASVEQIDGSTIRPLLDMRGRTPRPPIPAYTQAIKGRNWQWFTADRLLYRPFNTSASSPYGKSPIEFLVLRINEALRRQFASTAYWDQTNVPEAMAYLPSDWTPENISKFQDYFDAMLVGDVAKLRRIKFMPSAGGGTPIYEFRRPDAAANNAFDEWMLKMTCYAFGFLPSELGLTPGSGLGGKGFMDGQENALYRFGIGPLVQYLQNLFSGIVARQTKAPLVWRFKDMGPSEDKAAEASLLQIQLQNGIIDINVWRAKAGQPPIENAKPFMMVGGVPTTLDKIFSDAPEPAAPATIPDASAPAPETTEPSAEPAPEPVPASPVPSAADNVAGALLSERRYGKVFEPEPEPLTAFEKMALDHWREKAVRRMKDGKRADCDPPAASAPVLSVGMVTKVRRGLALAGDAAMVSTIFKAISSPKARALPGEHAHGCTCAHCSTAGLSKAAKKKMTTQEKKVYAALLTVMSEASDEFADAILRGEPVALSDFDDEMLDQLRPMLRDIMEESIYAGQEDVGVPLGEGVASTRASEWAEEHAGELIDGLADTTREIVGGAVSEYLAGNEMTIGDLVDALAPAFGEARAESIAVTEVTRAAAAGMGAFKDEAEKLGVRLERVNNTNYDDLVCPICEPLNGAPESEWEDPQGPPWHPRCRCFITFKVVSRPAPGQAEENGGEGGEEE